MSNINNLHPMLTRHKLKQIMSKNNYEIENKNNSSDDDSEDEIKYKKVIHQKSKIIETKCKYINNKFSEINLLFYKYISHIGYIVNNKYHDDYIDYLFKHTNSNLKSFDKSITKNNKKETKMEYIYLIRFTILNQDDIVDVFYKFGKTIDIIKRIKTLTTSSKEYKNCFGMIIPIAIALINNSSQVEKNIKNNSKQYKIKYENKQELYEISDDSYNNFINYFNETTNNTSKSSLYINDLYNIKNDIETYKFTNLTNSKKYNYFTNNNHILTKDINECVHFHMMLYPEYDDWIAKVESHLDI